MTLIDVTYFLAALLFVLALMGGLALILKKLGIAGPAVTIAGKKRLSVTENLSLDSRRRLVLVKHDDTEHLILLGHNSDCVISTKEKNIIQSGERDESNS